MGLAHLHLRWSCSKHITFKVTIDISGFTYVPNMFIMSFQDINVRWRVGRNNLLDQSDNGFNLSDKFHCTSSTNRTVFTQPCPDNTLLDYTVRSFKKLLSKVTMFLTGMFEYITHYIQCPNYKWQVLILGLTRTFFFFF